MRFNLKEYYVFLLCLTATTCKNFLTTQEELDANFITSGLTAIDLLSPTANQQVATANPSFSFSPRGVSLYTIQIAADAGFSKIVLNKDMGSTSYTLQNSDLIGVSSLSTQTYYWRVKIPKISNNLQSKTQSFFLVAVPSSGSGYAGVLYVDASSGSSLQVGSKEAPYKKIQTAISAADTLRNNSATVAMDIFVAQGSYVEEISLAPGISIRGGYENQQWSRSITGNTTTITALSDIAVRGGPNITTSYTQTTIVEGFTIKGSASSAATNEGFHLVNASPTISNNFILGGTATGNNAYGLEIRGGSPVINGNTIIGSTTSTSGYIQAVYNSDASAIITNNLILGSSNVGGLSYVGVEVQGGSPTIANNTIIGASASSPNGHGIEIQAGGLNGTPIIQNNIVFNGGYTGNCIKENGAAVNSPSVFANNNLFGCSVLYADTTGGTMNNICAATGNFWTGAGCTGTQLTTPTGSGNVNIDNTGNQLFLSINGTDGNIATLSDNDWHLTTNAAICNVRGGGLNLSSLLTLDKDSLSRTTGNPSGGCVPGNTGATGWSMGAFESN